VVLNRGLLHADIMVKHSSLRVLIEALTCLRRLTIVAETHVRTEGINSSVTQLKPAVEEDIPKLKSIRLSQSIVDLARAALPDPNTLLAILSGLKLAQRSNMNRTSSQSPGVPASNKRKRKELESATANQAVKISTSDAYEYDATIRLLWGDEVSDEGIGKDGIEGFLYAKVVQVLAAYQV
jgi:nucleolar pre-ribosomal-associated protein 1